MYGAVAENGIDFLDGGSRRNPVRSMPLGKQPAQGIGFRPGELSVRDQAVQVRSRVPEPKLWRGLGPQEERVQCAGDRGGVELRHLVHLLHVVCPRVDASSLAGSASATR